MLATRAVPCCVLLTLLGGCLDRELAVLHPQVSRSIDDRVVGDGVADVDLLIVIDDSGSMDEEQRLIREQIPSLVRGLVSPPDRDGDGRPDWNALETLHIAVVTTDLGTSGYPTDRVARCGTQGATGDAWGYDGQLRADVACDPAASPVQTWEAGQDADAFATRVGCLAEAGDMGCGFEQPLLAAARALGRAEHDFPRPEALLAVLVVTDEEDCSLGDVNGFFESVVNPGDLNVHCARSVERLEPVGELLAELSAGRDPERLVFAAIAGIPVDLVGAEPAVILADPRMQYLEDPTTQTGLAYACQAHNADGTPRSLATPARRIVELGSMLDGSLVRSICEDSFEPAVAELTRRIGSRITSICLGRALTPAADGSVDCVVRETLPPGAACAGRPARAFFGLDETGREICQIDQSPGGHGSGWFYDLTDRSCDQLAFTEDAVPPFGATVRFQCLVQVEDEGITGGGA